jgi:hypothetical protein
MKFTATLLFSLFSLFAYTNSYTTSSIYVDSKYKKSIVSHLEKTYKNKGEFTVLWVKKVTNDNDKNQRFKLFGVLKSTEIKWIITKKKIINDYKSVKAEYLFGPNDSLLKVINLKTDWISETDYVNFKRSPNYKLPTKQEYAKTEVLKYLRNKTNTYQSYEPQSYGKLTAIIPPDSSNGTVKKEDHYTITHLCKLTTTAGDKQFKSFKFLLNNKLQIIDVKEKLHLGLSPYQEQLLKDFQKQLPIVKTPTSFYNDGGFGWKSHIAANALLYNHFFYFSANSEGDRGQLLNSYLSTIDRYRYAGDDNLDEIGRSAIQNWFMVKSADFKGYSPVAFEEILPQHITISYYSTVAIANKARIKTSIEYYEWLVKYARAKKLPTETYQLVLNDLKEDLKEARRELTHYKMTHRFTAIAKNGKRKTYKMQFEFDPYFNITKTTVIGVKFISEKLSIAPQSKGLPEQKQIEESLQKWIKQNLKAKNEYTSGVFWNAADLQKKKVNDAHALLTIQEILKIEEPHNKSGMSDFPFQIETLKKSLEEAQKLSGYYVYHNFTMKRNGKTLHFLMYFELDKELNVTKVKDLSRSWKN